MNHQKGMNNKMSRTKILGYATRYFSVFKNHTVLSLYLFRSVTFYLLLQSALLIKKATSFLLFSLVIISCGFLFACSKSHDKVQSENATPVSVMKISEKQVQLRYESTGFLQPIINPTIKAGMAGHITKVNVSVGQKIKANQILAKIDDSQFELAYKQAKAEEGSAAAQIRLKDLEQKSNKVLLEKGLISKLSYAKTETAADIARAKMIEMQQHILRASHQLRKTIIRSPIDGYVQKVNISQGDYVTAGEPLFVLINHSVLQARLPFSQEQAVQFKVGQRVNLLSPATPGKEYIGQVSEITPLINPLNRSLDVIVNFKSDNLWHAGASIRGHVYLDKQIKAFTIPIESIVLYDNQNFVFTVVNNKAVQKQVTILRENNNLAIVTGKIKTNDILVVHGAQYLTNGAAVSIQHSDQEA